MVICHLCGKQKECLPKQIDGREYDICTECWNFLAQKLKGKGRAKGSEVVLLPPATKGREDDDAEPFPGEPPKIWGTGDNPGAQKL